VRLPLAALDRPRDLGGSDSWEDAEPCRHSGRTPEKLRERAAKMVLEIRSQDGKGRGELGRVARQLGVHLEALRTWVRQAEIDGGIRPGTTTEASRGTPGLEKEVRELRRANEILKAASAYFARELDPRRLMQNPRFSRSTILGAAGQRGGARS
jgi:transposase